LANFFNKQFNCGSPKRKEKVHVGHISQGKRHQKPIKPFSSTSDNGIYSFAFILKDLVQFSNKFIFRKASVGFMALFLIVRTLAPNIIRQIFGHCYFGLNAFDTLFID
jgi:hypothetical protein